MPPSLSQKLLKWYGIHKRDLPWRENPEPYAIWVIEIMAQQTRIETVLPYFERWMSRFPKISDLAAASQQEVLNLWEGLGYYSRARNIHKAAQMVMDNFDGKLPQNIKALRSLPGIGRYTAGAIASQAFGLNEPVVDGNIKRLLARVFKVEKPVDTSAGEKKIWALAAENLPSGQASDYNQALMELGATVCLPRNPNCKACPLMQDCLAFAEGIQTKLPIKKPKKAIPHHTVTAAVIEENGLLLIAQRPQDGLLGGMWEFPGGKVEEGEGLETCLKREIKEELGVKIKVSEEIGVYQHAYTHFKVTLHAFACQLNGGRPKSLQVSEIRWVSLDELADYPMGKLDRQISLKLQQMNGQQT